MGLNFEGHHVHGCMRKSGMFGTCVLAGLATVFYSVSDTRAAWRGMHHA